MVVVCRTRAKKSDAKSNFVISRKQIIIPPALLVKIRSGINKN